MSIVIEEVNPAKIRIPTKSTSEVPKTRGLFFFFLSTFSSKSGTPAHNRYSRLEFIPTQNRWSIR